MKFTKMQGAGNDYVYINCFTESIADPESLARAVSNRNFGIGSDGLILILPSDCADLRMRMFNADGSEAEMCGNGIRCVAKYAYDHGLVTQDQISIETGNGVLSVQVFVGSRKRVEQVRVVMGQPGLTRGSLPMTGAAGAQAINVPLEVAGHPLELTCISMGNPHAVIYVENVNQFPVAQLGSIIEHHHWFPKRTNVEFVQIISSQEVIQRTWERGAGETLACGTGAAAVTVAGVLTGRSGRIITNHLRGGDLLMEWPEGGEVLMTGPAVEVFSGIFDPK